jgi:two-component system KDP operon response regulator KdpE
MVIEDDQGLRLLFGKALEHANFKVLLAANVRDALELLADHTPDIAFIDVNMPGSLGTNVLSHLKSTPRLAKTRTVVVTANTQAASLAEDLGADLFLLKPVSIVELMTLANRLVGANAGAPQ